MVDSVEGFYLFDGVDVGNRIGKKSSAIRRHLITIIIVHIGFCGRREQEFSKNPRRVECATCKILRINTKYEYEVLLYF